MAAMESASAAIGKALSSPEHKIYIYGCGSTGRLAKQIECETWKQFWKRIKETPANKKVEEKFGSMYHKVIGELTGGDRALVNSLEGFEDL